MSDRLKALREKRGKVVTDMRAVHEGATAAKRDMTGEELAKHEELFNASEELRKQITAEERQAETDREAAAAKEAEERAKREAESSDVDGNAMLGAAKPSEVTCRKLVGFFADTYGLLGRHDKRAVLQSGSFTGGGALLPMEQLVDQLIKNVDDESVIRPRATKFRVPAAESLGVPTLDTDPNDADWTTELKTGSEDTAMAFGKRNLHPHPFAKRVKISKDLLMRLPSIEAFVRSRVAYKFAITEEKGFLTGDGVQRPLGLFTASPDGIPTGRDVSEGNTATEIRFDGLIEAKYTVKAAYWNSAVWLFHRDAVKQISKLKDGEGQYLWRQSVREGEPDSVLGRPMVLSEFAPNDFTTGLYVGLFGDLSHYWIADAMDLEMQLLTELYAETNQIGVIGRAKADGMPTLAEAFARVKLA